MKRTTIFLDESAERDLKALAQRRDVPMADLVREALGRYLVEEKRGESAPLSFIAIGRSGRSDTAERHEELLWLEPHPSEPAKKASTRKRRGAAPKR
jgi:hypothetical protein